MLIKKKHDVHAVVGIIINNKNEVLISFRHKDKDQGALWEFPGGKKEGFESIESALKREFREELNISLEEFSPLMRIKHRYDNKYVLLDVWIIKSFKGEPVGVEGQPIEWRSVKSLRCEDFPSANAKIIKTLQAD